MSTLLEYRLRIRDRADTTDALVVSSVRSDTLPYLTQVPSVDGAEFDPLTGQYRSGSASFQIADAMVSGSRVITSQLEDADFRQQMAGLPAYGEYRENGGSWQNLQAGIVTGVRMVSKIEWVVEIGDAMRATRNLTAFSPKRDPIDSTKLEPLTDYLTRWPNRGCIIGGPVRGGFLTLPDHGGWEYRVSKITSSSGVPLVYLEFVGGALATAVTSPHRLAALQRTTDAIDVDGPINGAIGSPASAYSWGQPFTLDTVNTGPFPGLVVEIDGAYYQAALADTTMDPFIGRVGFSVVGRGFGGIFVYDPGSTLSVSSTVHRVNVYDALPTERSPIYYSGHPLDLWTKLCDEDGLAWDATAVTATKAALGTSLIITLRITAPTDKASFMENVLYGPCGFSVATNGAGKLAPFPTRVTNSGLPSTTITNADVPEGQAQLFTLSEPDAITKVSFSMQNLVPVTAGSDTTGPLDGMTTQDVIVERTSGDTNAPVQREQTYAMPGFLATQPNRGYEAGLVDAAAKEIFDRWGRGKLTGSLTALRTGSGASVVLGQEVIVGLKAMPNHNKRLLDDVTLSGRCVQIVRINPGAVGPTFDYVDSGPNAQPVATLPAFTLAAGLTPGSVLVTITNAASLNAAHIATRFQWTTSTGGTPASSAYSDVAAFGADAVPTAAFTLPTALAGTTVYVRARSEQAGLRPSSWSSVVSYATSGFSAPSSLTGTPTTGDGTSAALSWAIGAGATDKVTDVFVRLSADPSSADVLRATLLPSSIAYLVDGLTPSTSYTASVQHRDPSTGDVSSKTTVTFTTASSTPTLTVPDSPTVFAGIHRGSAASLDGTYGLAVVATELPGAVQFREAIETAVGSGSYGTPAILQTLAGVLGDWTTLTLVAPNDGLRRQLSARSVVAGNVSAWTTPIAVLPWSIVILPQVPGSGLPSFSSVMVNVYDYSANQLQLDFTPVNPPAGATYNITLYQQTHLTDPDTGITIQLFGVSPGVVQAVLRDIDASGIYTKRFTMTVFMLDGPNVVAQGTDTEVYNSNN